MSQEQEDADIEVGAEDEVQTLELVRQEGDRQVLGLRFMVDLPSKHPDGRCPMLDLKVWKEESDEGGGVW